MDREDRVERFLDSKSADYELRIRDHGRIKVDVYRDDDYKASFHIYDSELLEAEGQDVDGLTEDKVFLHCHGTGEESLYAPELYVFDETNLDQALDSAILYLEDIEDKRVLT